MKDKIGERQRWAWQTAALSAVAACCLCKISWLWVLLGSIAVTIYQIILETHMPEQGLANSAVSSLGWFGKLVLLLTWGWTIYTMGWAAGLADRAFPMIHGTPILGWIILAVAAWGSWKGTAVCARCCSVLSLFLICIYGLVLAFAIPEVQFKNLNPTGTWIDSIQVLGLLLVGSGVWYGPIEKSEKRAGWRRLLLPLMAAGLSAITTGMLSPGLVQLRQDPFYDVAKSISLFGVMERIEPLLSVAMTMGVFALLTTMATACQSIGQALKPGRWYGCGSCAAAIPLLLLDYKTGEIQTFGAILVWLILPVLLLVGNWRNRANT